MKNISSSCFRYNRIRAWKLYFSYMREFAGDNATLEFLLEEALSNPFLSDSQKMQLSRLSYDLRSCL